MLSRSPQAPRSYKLHLRRRAGQRRQPRRGLQGVACAVRLAAMSTPARGDKRGAAALQNKMGPKNRPRH